ncbi:MAG: hypothetical protein EOP35_04140 [Rubrivivax sp.]|nr:MAG: hypothetical protein EOP35_04140 [Rubrivivax sp.]
MPTLRLGDRAVRIRVPVGDALVVTAPAGSSATVVHLSDMNPSATVTGATQYFGPYPGTKTLTVTCTAGAVSFDVPDASLDVTEDPASGLLYAGGSSLGAVSGGGNPWTITGTPAVGNVLTAAPSAGWQITSGQWYSDGVLISGAVAPTYTVQAADAGRLLSFAPAGLGYRAFASGAVPGTAVYAGAIEGASKIASMLAAMKFSNSQRVAIGWHGMSIDFGAGSNGSIDNLWHPEYQTLSLPAKFSAAINAARSGAFLPGIETVSGAGPVVGNSYFTLANGAVLGGAGQGLAGVAGQVVGLTAASSRSIAFDVTSAGTNQVVRIYGIAAAVGIIPRYSLSGSNTLAATALPTTTSNPIAGTTFHWYETTITLPLAGTTTVTLLGQSGAGGTWYVWGVDQQYAATAGLTVHRLSQSGSISYLLAGGGLDNTDTQPSSYTGWIGASGAAFRASTLDSLTIRPGLAGVIAGSDINDILAYSNNVGAYNYGWSLADHQRHLTNYVNGLAARGLQVLLVCGNLRSPDTPAITTPTVTPYTQRDIINVYKAVAAASTNAAFIDLSYPFYGASEQITYNNQVADTANWIASEAPRYVHPGPGKHLYYGNYLAAAIQAVW